MGFCIGETGEPKAATEKKLSLKRSSFRKIKVESKDPASCRDKRAETDWRRRQLVQVQMGK